MPLFSYVKAVLKWKACKLTLVLLLSPFVFYAQSLTGLWTGSLSNDSTTIRRDQSFEIALTEYKGKVYGYSRSEFIVNDTLFYIVKRVKGTIEGDICEVTDDEIIAYNFRGKLDKGIKVTSTFRRSQGDSVWHLDGNWKTNATRKYYAVTGKVGLAEEKDLTASKIFPHLEELNLANDIAFYRERVEQTPVVRVIKPERNQQVFKEPAGLSATSATGITAAEPSLARAESDYAKPLTAPGKNNAAFKEPAGIAAITTSNMEAAQPALARAESDYVKPVTAPGRNIEVYKDPVGLTATNTTNMAATQPALVRAESDYVKPLTATEKTTAVPSTGITEANHNIPAPKIKPSNDQVKIDYEKLNTKKNTEGKPAIVNETQTARQSTHTDITGRPGVSQAEKSAQAVVKTNKQAENRQNTQEPAAVKKTMPAVSPQKTEAGITSANMNNPDVKKPLVDVTLNAAQISGRKSEFTQAVNFKSDSLVIALYDNGEIDGDTVSVYMNGQIIMARQGLKAAAVKKTIYITPENEDFSLVLFADNLGKYPPNTGLLVVYDGDDIYNLRFSSDFQKNAGIVFRRKR